jgi:hypothetical protein
MATRTSESSEQAATMLTNSLVIEHDGPFLSRAFAQAVAVKEARHLPQWGRQ